MEDWLLWFLLAIALFVGEMFTAGFWLACLAVGAAVAGVVGLIPGLGFVPQGVAFAAASIVSMAGLRTRLRAPDRRGRAARQDRDRDRAHRPGAAGPGESRRRGLARCLQ